MPVDCENLKENLEHCNCSNEGCSRRGNCCACLKHHLANNRLPGCCFPDDAEKTWDRSIEHFCRIHSKK